MADESARTIRRKALGTLLRQARLEADRSQKECAELLGCSTRLISEFERGQKDISLTQLEALARSLRTPLSHFWKTEDSATSHLCESASIVQQRMLLRQKLVGAQLRQARLAADKSLADCADLLGCTSQRISEYEHGQCDIPLTDLEALAQFFAIPVQTFLDQEPAPAPAPSRSGPIPTHLPRPELDHLEPGLRDFVSKPINTLYLQVAFRLSRLSASELRKVAEALLEITY